MTDFLQANLSVLYGRQPGLRELGLEQVPSSERCRVERSAGGEPTASVEGVLLHSRYAPSREARRLLEREGGGSPTAAVFYGFGLGYLVEEFLRLHPGCPAVVVEPDVEVFRLALGSRDLTALLAREELRWELGREPEAVLMAVEELPLGEARVVRLRPACQLRSDYYGRLDRALTSLLDRREVNVNTLRRFGRLWVRNLLANMPLFCQRPGVGVLAGLFQGLPALVLAAGPSLEPVLGALQPLRERLLIVAVDTSLRLCLARGVQPDFLVTVDPQYWNSRHLDWTASPQSVVVSESAACPRLFRLIAFGQPLFFMSSFFPLGQFLEARLGRKGTLAAGGSVATTAWDLARLLGSAPIHMAGLDLGFPDRRTHCRGAFFEEAAHLAAGRLHTAEQRLFGYLHDAGPHPVSANDGGVTLSDRRMEIYRFWFQNRLKQAGAPATRSLSPRGVCVEGMPWVDWRRLLDLPPVRPQIDSAVGRAREAARRQQNALARAVEALGGLARELDELADEAGRGLSTLAALERRGPSSREGGRLLSELDGIDRRILQLSSREVASFLFQPLIQRIAGGGQGADVLAANREIYRELAESAGYHAALIRARLAPLAARSTHT